MLTLSNVIIEILIIIKYFDSIMFYRSKLENGRERIYLIHGSNREKLNRIAVSIWISGYLESKSHQLRPWVLQLMEVINIRTAYNKN